MHEDVVIQQWKRRLKSLERNATASDLLCPLAVIYYSQLSLGDECRLVQGYINKDELLYTVMLY